VGLSAAEQYAIELLNRARLDPVAEAKRFGLGAGTVPAKQLQVLAPNRDLDEAATKHTTWMISTDNWGHVGIGGNNAGQRMAAAGYDRYGSFSWAENLAATDGGSGNVAEVLEAHRLLMRSSDHRNSIMSGSYNEVGYAQVFGNLAGAFRSVVTENFANNYDVFVTGVAYSDKNGNGFYNVGEGRDGIRFEVAGGGAGVGTMAAGGYALKVGQTKNITVDIGDNGSFGTVSLRGGGGNVKLDLVGRDTVLVSASANLVDGIRNARLLGINDTSLSGTDGANTLVGNKGRNTLDGEGGNDRLVGGKGADRFEFHASGDNDRISDFSKGQGDRLALNSRLFDDDPSVRDIVQQYAKVVRGDVVFDFGNGDTLTLVGLNTTTGLSDHITIL
jgi:Ca2+-binding RTX toxin-like protein